MMTVEELELAVDSLTQEEYGRFRRWFLGIAIGKNGTVRSRKTPTRADLISSFAKQLKQRIAKGSLISDAPNDRPILGTVRSIAGGRAELGRQELPSS